MSNVFYIVRHGESANNVLEIYNSHPDDQELYGLTDQGRAQVTGAAQSINPINKIFTSPFRRTRETAEIFAKETGAELYLDERLREIDLGTLHHQTHIDLPDVAENEPLFGGESIAEIRDRMMDFVKEINARHQNTHILIVTHGGPMEVIRHYVQNDRPFRFSGLSKVPANGVVVPLLV